jgi:hypothetical protein
MLPEKPCESYRELVDLELAHSVRWARRPDGVSPLEPDALDLAILELVAHFKHILSSQLHRHLNAARAMTTTQRRLKRLSDAGLVERFQFHRRDGGGVPMCYVLSERGLRELQSAGRLGPEPHVDGAAAASAPGRSAEPKRQLRQACHDVRVAGWALALLSGARQRRFAVLGSERATMSPPSRSSSGARIAVGPSDLRLPGGRVPHDFLRARGDEIVEVERFETIRPDAIVELAADGRGGTLADGQSTQGRALDVIVELDDLVPQQRGAAKLARYDHFLAGWSAHTRRYGERREAEPLVVFVCRDRSHARSGARLADGVLRACRAYAGEYPFDWEYPGRERMLFAAERDMHEGLRRAYGIARLPPAVRIVEAHGDPRAGETSAQPRAIP